MGKTAVYRWCVDSRLKRRLEAAARAEKTSVSSLIERIAREWLHRVEEDDEAQRRVRGQAAKRVDAVGSGDRNRSEQVRERIRAKLRAKHERLQREAHGDLRRAK